MLPILPQEYRQLVRNDFLAFAQRGFYSLNPQTVFSWAAFIEQIATKLEAVRKGKIKRLIICLPPRSLKSHLASVAFPAWYLGHDPSLKIIAVSYGQDLADKFARDCRTLMCEPWYQTLFPNTRMASRQAVAELRTTWHGYRMATSIGGTLTGRGGDLIIIDDPLKPADALSEPARTGANEWYDNTLLSRLNSKKDGAIVIIAQRLHQDDLIGHVLPNGGWEVLSFPAIAEADKNIAIDTPYGRQSFDRKTGDALHPARESRKVLDQLRETMGEYNFQAQYQQAPAPLGGAMIKTAWLKYYEPGSEPAFSSIVQSWDTANKPGELNDNSVCTTWGARDHHYYLLHVYRQKLNFPDLKRAVCSLAEQFRPQTILIEDKASGTQLIQELRTAGLFGIKSYEPRPGSDKIMRLHEQATGFENGLVLLPTVAPWLTEYKNELTTFPGSKYDDQVDSTSQALDYMRSIDTNLEIWAKLGRDPRSILFPQQRSQYWNIFSA